MIFPRCIRRVWRNKSHDLLSVFEISVRRESGKTGQRVRTAPARVRAPVRHHHRERRHRGDHRRAGKGNGTSTHDTAVGTRGVGVLNFKREYRVSGYPANVDFTF